MSIFPLQVGVKCWVKLSDSQDKMYKCHIQEMNPKKGTCVVFVEELAEKRSVTHSCLQPMNDAKWALPHRFKRNRTNVAANAYDLSRKFSLCHHPFHEKKSPSTHKKHQKYADIDNDVYDCVKAFDNRYRDVEPFYDLDSYTDLSHFQPYQFDLVTMPLNTYYRANSHHHNNGGERGNANSNYNNQKPHQQQKNGRNAQQAPKQPENQIQLLKRDADDEVMTPTPTPQQSHPGQQPHGAEHQVDVSAPPPPLPAVPMHYTNSSGCVQYFYPSSECVDPNYYNVPAEMVASQPMYVPAPAYAPAPIPMQPATTYAVAPAASQLYTVPMAGWSPSGNSASK